MYRVDKLKDPKWRKYSNSCLPTKYIDHNIEDFRILGDTPTIKKHNENSYIQFLHYMDDIENNLKNGYGLMLCGSVGIAKTWLMTHLAKKIISIFDEENAKIQEQNLQKIAGYNVFRYIQATTISQLVFTTGLNEDELNLRRNLKKLAGLWIDDISKMAETKSGHEIAFLDDILRWRDLNVLTTFYTSQLPFDSIGKFEGLDKVLSKPIHDLIRGNCLVLTFRGESQR